MTALSRDERPFRVPLPAVLVAATAALALLLFGPQALAAAGTHGEAAGVGEEESITTGDHYGPGPPAFCLEVTDSKYRVDLTGEFYGDADDQAGYIGAAELHWETTETYWIGPEGTYTDADEAEGCDEDTLGDPIEARVWVEAVPTDGGQISGCESTEPAYFRIASDVTVQWTGDCDIEPNESLSDLYDPGRTGDVGHLFTGEFDAGTGALVGTWLYPDVTS